MSETMVLDGCTWRLRTDPDDVGRQANWQAGPRPDAVPATVPCAIQEVFGACCGTC